MVTHTPPMSPANSRKLTRKWECLNRLRHMSDAMQIKLPATNTSMYCRVLNEMLCELRPMQTPTSEIRFTRPLLSTVSRQLNRLFRRIATSPISRGIQWAMMPTVTGRNSLGLPMLKATPIASPSMKLWISELIRFRKPVASFASPTSLPFSFSSCLFSSTCLLSSQSECQWECAMPPFSMSLSRKTKEMREAMKIRDTVSWESAREEQASGTMCMAQPSNAPQEKAKRI